MLGFLYKHRGAVESPIVEMRRPVRTSLALFHSRWYTLGIVVAMAGWGFHVGALALAPISLVQSVIAGGLVMLTVVAERLFKLPITRREWIGVALIAFGLAFLFPVVLVFLQLAGVLTSARLKAWRRPAIVAVFVVAAVITPSQDPYSLFALAGPMYLFYEASIVIGRLLRR